MRQGWGKTYGLGQTKSVGHSKEFYQCAIDSLWLNSDIIGLHFKMSLANVWRVYWRGNSGSKEISQKALQQVRCKEIMARLKWIKQNKGELVNSRHVLEVDLMRYIDGLFIKSEGEREDMPLGFLI